VHHRPSTVGVDTLVKSNGKIPALFLRGCGVPDSWIEYLPSLIGALQPFHFYSCFISYSTKDEEFAKRLHERMRTEELRVWFAPEDIKGGEKLHEQIEHAIQVHDRLLLVLSEQSIQSEWVTTELYNARQAEIKGNRRKLFPIRLCSIEMLKAWKCFDIDTGKDLAREVREYFIPDFSNWKDPDAFEVGFARLLRDLKAVNSPPIRAPTAVQREQHTVSMSARAHLESLLATKTRRLQHLEQQQAFKGANTAPEVLMELADLRHELSDLEHRLGDEGSKET